MSEETLELEGAVHQVLCVLDCQEEALHEEALDRAVRIAHALGWQLRAGISIDENLLRTANLSFLSCTGMESGRCRQFDLKDLQSHLDRVVSRLRRRLGSATRALSVSWVVEEGGAVSDTAPASGAVLWWRLPRALTLLPLRNAPIAGRRAILLDLRGLSPDERRLLNDAVEALGGTPMIEIPSASERPPPGQLATDLLPHAPGLLVVALPSPCDPETAGWVEDLQRNLGTTALILR